MRKTTCLTPVLLLCLIGTASGGSEKLQIGISKNFFHDMTPKLIQSVTDPFADLMRDSTGLKGELDVDGKPFDVAQQLSDKKVQIGVFHGFEFAWIQQKHADLRPLMIAVNSDHPVTAHVLIRKDSKIGAFADLKGKSIAMPKRTKEHCRYFVEQCCEKAGAAGSKAFFAQIVVPENVEAGLDELAQGKFQAIVIDAIGLDFYKDLKPGVFNRFQVLTESAKFPPQVVAYRLGGLDDKTMGLIRDGLTTASKSEKGRDMLKSWYLTSFEPVPKTFSQTMAESLKTFPPQK